MGNQSVDLAHVLANNSFPSPGVPVRRRVKQNDDEYLADEIDFDNILSNSTDATYFVSDENKDENQHEVAPRTLDEADVIKKKNFKTKAPGVVLKELLQEKQKMELEERRKAAREYAKKKRDKELMIAKAKREEDERAKGRRAEAVRQVRLQQRSVAGDKPDEAALSKL